MLDILKDVAGLVWFNCRIWDFTFAKNKLKQIKKISKEEWINHYKKTWNIYFFQRGIKSTILFFKIVCYMIQLIQSKFHPGNDCRCHDSASVLPIQLAVRGLHRTPWHSSFQFSCKQKKIPWTISKHCIVLMTLHMMFQTFMFQRFLGSS